MLNTAKEVYAETVRALTPGEQLRLAALILDKLTRPAMPPGLVDSAEDWTDQDRMDLTAFSLQYAGSVYPEDEGLI